jgi:hypothetical protein
MVLPSAYITDARIVEMVTVALDENPEATKAFQDGE